MLDPRNGAAFDLPPDPSARVWVLASTPRTGSTLLGRLLEDTGGAGVPKEWLNPMQVRDMEARLGPDLWTRWRHRALRGPAIGAVGRGRWSDARLLAYLDRVRQVRSRDGWFALKLHAHHHRRWFVDAGRSIDAVLAPAVWVRIRRRDPLLQAVSWYRAQQTGRWADWQRAWAPPVFHGPSILALRDRVLADEASWDRLLGGRTALTLWYEDLVADMEGSVRRVLGVLGAPEALTRAVALPAMRRQSDEINEAWAARLR